MRGDGEPAYGSAAAAAENCVNPPEQAEGWISVITREAKSQLRYMTAREPEGAAPPDAKGHGADSFAAFANFARLHKMADGPTAGGPAAAHAAHEEGGLDVTKLAHQFAHFMHLEELGIGGEPPDSGRINHFKHQFTDFMHWTHGAAPHRATPAEIAARERFAKLSSRFLHAHHPELAAEAGVPPHDRKPSAALLDA